MSSIQTVTGDLDPAQVGMTYLHEHLIGGSLKPDGDPDLTLDSEANASAELQQFYHVGGRTIVEMSPRDHGRNPLALQRISRASNVNIVCVTGYIKSASADPFLEAKSVTALADEMIQEVSSGIDSTEIRAGVLKAGSSKNKITPNEAKLFQAAAIAQRETGAPISTHTEAGTMALEQIALLKQAGVPAERILIGHLDRKLDWAYHLAIAQTGVMLGYDQFSKEKYAPDSERIAYVVKMVQAGFRQQLALSGDLARRSNFPSYGGNVGYAFILTRILPLLAEAGLSADDIHTLMVANPARLLTIQK